MTSLREPQALNSRHVAIIWQRFLPYHVARIRELRNKLDQCGSRLTAFEIASQDLTYKFPSCTAGLEHVCCFPDSVYHMHSAQEIHGKVLRLLQDLEPEVVLAPATAFPEGMAAIAYRCLRGGRVILMDSAWEHTDRRGLLTRTVKRLIHRNVDAIFSPAPSHNPYYMDLGFSTERIVHGIEVVDNDYFAEGSLAMRKKASALKGSWNLPENYFLFVGRFLPGKGLDTLIRAFQHYSERCATTPWSLVLAGSGPMLDEMLSLIQGNNKIIVAGAHYGLDLCAHYALASAFVFPTLSDTWGLAVNEAMATGLPVLVSSGCGAAKTLVRDGENGWVFEAADVQRLAKLMVRMASLPQGDRTLMGERSKEIVAEWSLDRFVAGALQAIAVPRRPPAGFLSDSLTHLWKGRVSIN